MVGVRYRDMWCRLEGRLSSWWWRKRRRRRRRRRVKKKEEGEEEVEVYECLGWRRTRQTLRPSIPSFTVKA